MSALPDVVMRSRNDGALVGATLAGIKGQRMGNRLVVFDNASTDGSLEIIGQYADEIVAVPEGQYVPGRVLNDAMRRTTSPFVVFVNSDCTPLDDRWLETLLSGFDSEDVVATFGQQVPRPDCWPLFAKDTVDTFGDGARQKYWRHCFSMASSAIRRSAWERSPFREDLKYSEDVDWTWRQRQMGGVIRYAPESRVYHSHNYTLAQWRKRQFGEGYAESTIFEWQPWEESLLRYSVMPLARQILSDVRYGIRSGQWRCLWDTVPMRWVQMMGRREGFLQGRRDAQG